MKNLDHDYYGLKADAWDLLRGDTSKWPDRQFYHQVIEEAGEPALDVGCGTGRLLLDYLGQGLDVEGIDISSEMLELCRQRADELGLRVTLYQGSMENMDLPRKYRTLFVPSSSFQLVIDPTTASRAIQRFFDHLLPNGKLVMPFMLPRHLYTKDTDVVVDAGEWRMREAQWEEDGATIRHWSRSTYDVKNQIEHEEERFELIMGGEIVTTEHHQDRDRWYTQEQAVSLYEGAGFGNIRVVSGFSFEPAKPADTLFCVLGTRP
jgi:ubiquinone/menaquinone biosynthesis C-methylase UbiE